MSEEKDAKIKELYYLAEKSKQSPPPKRALFGTKCPQCGAKLSKESVKKRMLAGAGDNEIEKKIATEASLADGLYDLAIECFSCKCGYKFARVEVNEVVDLTG